MKKLLLLTLFIVGCAVITFNERQSEKIILGTWEGNLIINDIKLTFTFISDGTLTTNFGDDGILTWDLKGDTLTFYENGKIDDIVYLTIINENKFIIKNDKNDDEGMPFIRKILNPQ